MNVVKQDKKFELPSSYDELLELIIAEYSSRYYPNEKTGIDKEIGIILIRINESQTEIEVALDNHLKGIQSKVDDHMKKLREDFMLYTANIENQNRDLKIDIYKELSEMRTQMDIANRKEKTYVNIDTNSKILKYCATRNLAYFFLSIVIIFQFLYMIYYR